MGGGELSAWGGFILAPPSGAILDYVADGWVRFAAQFRNAGQPLHERDEPALTNGLGQFLIDEAMRGRQPFAGDFYFELHRCELRPDGTIKTVGRTDLEWRLWGAIALVIEFKILGPGRRTIRYLSDGLARFLDGRYTPTGREAAMCALVRPCPPGVDPIREVEYLIDRDASIYKCSGAGGTVRCSPSNLAPVTARFDTLHNRDAPMPAITLAHIFLNIPCPANEAKT